MADDIFESLNMLVSRHYGELGQENALIIDNNYVAGIGNGKWWACIARLWNRCSGEYYEFLLISYTTLVRWAVL